MVSVSDYNEVKECIYKGEHYSVRDNGAVMRHPREGMRRRKLDNVWTFGNPNDKTGYMEIAGQSVHRIVTFAFHGNPPTDQYVVDHIDTNRRNNRPENLRWLTRLENALNNPITRARIENLCGSIEAFLADPSILRGNEKIYPDFSWMRTVTPEEARASLERLTNWAKEHPKPQGGSLGEWVFQEGRVNSGNYHQDNELPELNIGDYVIDHNFGEGVIDAIVQEMFGKVYRAQFEHATSYLRRLSFRSITKIIPANEIQNTEFKLQGKSTDGECMPNLNVGDHVVDRDLGEGVIEACEQGVYGKYYQTQFAQATAHLMNLSFRSITNISNRENYGENHSSHHGQSESY